MARAWNPTTQRYEDDGQPETRPTSPPIVTTIEPSSMPQSPMTGPAFPPPSEVMPSDLPTDTIPAPPSQARRYASIDQPTGEAPAVEVPAYWDAAANSATPVAAAAPAGRPMAAPPPPAAPAKPGMMVTGTASTSGTEGERMTAQGALRQGALDTDVAAEVANSAARSDQEKALGQKNLGTLQGVNKQINAAQAETDRQVALQNQAIARFEDHVAARRAKLESQPIEGLMASKSDAAKLVAAISGAVGAYAAIHSGGRNFAQETIDKAVDNDFKVQAARIANDKDLLELAKQDVGAAELKKKGMLYDLGIKKIALLDAAERIRSEDLAAHGVATADIAKDEKLNAIQKKRDEEKAALKDSFVKDVHSYTVQKGPVAPAGAQSASNLIFAPGGKPFGQAPTPEIAKETNQKVAAYATLKKDLTEYRGIVRDHAKDAILDRTVAGRAQALRSAILFGVNHMVNPNGVMRPSEQEYFEAMVPDMTGWSGTTTSRAKMVAKLDQLDKLAATHVGSSLDAVGVDAKRAVKLIDQMALSGQE